MSAHGGQDWVGLVIVFVIGALALGALWLECRDWLRRSDAELQRIVNEIAPRTRCEDCGCQVRPGHEPGSEACLELQAERAVRAEVRAREWSE